MECSKISNQRTCKTFLLMCVCAFMFMFVMHAQAEDGYVVVCNAANPVSSISHVDLMNIFLGKKVSWNDGKKITFVTLKEGDSHKKFLRNHVKKNPQQFKNYWKKMLFTGKGVIPRSFSDDSGVIGFVKANESSIGYLSKEQVADGIKILPINN